MGFLDRIKDALRGVGAGLGDGTDGADDASDQRPRQATDDTAGAAAPDSTTPSGPSSGERHRTTTVLPGETLADVARRCEVDEDAIVALNGIERPDRVYGGQVFKIPDA